MNKFFKALDDSSRRQILDLLKDKDMTAGEIANKFNMTKPSISYHLNLLRQGELVVSIKKGQYIFYSLNTQVIDEAVRWFFTLIKGKIKSDKKRAGAKQ